MQLAIEPIVQSEKLTSQHYPILGTFHQSDNIFCLQHAIVHRANCTIGETHITTLPRFGHITSE